MSEERKEIKKDWMMPTIIAVITFIVGLGSQTIFIGNKFGSLETSSAFIYEDVKEIKSQYNDLNSRLRLAEREIATLKAIIERGK